MPAIEVHSRDFLASLSRVTQLNDNYFRRVFEADTLSCENMVKNLDVSILSKFNSMNCQCMLPRIDQGLMHSPQLDT